jgi:hypothetical protein
MDNTVSVNNFPASPDGESGSVIQQPTTVPVPAPQYTQNGDAPNAGAMFPDAQGSPKLAPQGMSPLQLGLRGALLGIAAGLAQRTAGAGAAAGANAGSQVADQNQQNIDNQNKAAQEKQQANDQHQLVLANLQLHNIQMMQAQQQVKNGTLDYYDKLANSTKAAVNTSQDSDGFQVYGTQMSEDVVKQKYMEIHQQNPNARVTYGVDGSTTDANGNVVPTFSLYDPGSGMVKLTPEKIQQLKDSGIQIPANVPADSQVSTTVLNNWRSQSVQSIAMQKSKADADAATANAQTAQTNAKYADQKDQQAIKEGNARIALTRAQTANQYAEAAKNKILVSSAADAKMLDTGINPVTKQKLTLDNAPDEMLIDDATKQPIPFKMLSTLKPTSQEINRGDFANSVLHSLDQLDNLRTVGKLPNGPLSGLTTKALTKAGMSDADAQKAMNFISFAQSAATGAHVGGRFSVPILQKMGDMIQINMNDSQFKGAEDSIRDVMTQYARQGGRLTVGQYKQQLAGQQQQTQPQQQQNVTPKTHVFSVSTWQKANPKGDVNAAKAAATQQGFQVVQ